nr:oleosin-B6-like [Aegilops tauschii subsp. strangulata]
MCRAGASPAEARRGPRPAPEPGRFPAARALPRLPRVPRVASAVRRLVFLAGPRAAAPVLRTGDRAPVSPSAAASSPSPDPVDPAPATFPHPLRPPRRPSPTSSGPASTSAPRSEP